MTDRARIIEMARQAVNEEGYAFDPELDAPEWLGRFAALVLAQAMEPAGSGSGHSAAAVAEASTAQPQEASRRELDMAMLIRMLCSHTAGPKTRERAMAYLVREGLQGSPLRAVQPVDKSTEMQGPSVDKSPDLQCATQEPFSEELVRQCADAAGLETDLWDMGAASLVYSGGVSGIPRAELVNFARILLIRAAPPQPKETPEPAGERRARLAKACGEVFGWAAQSRRSADTARHGSDDPESSRGTEK